MNRNLAKCMVLTPARLHHALLRPLTILSDDVTHAVIQCRKPALGLVDCALSRLMSMEVMGTIKVQDTRVLKWQGLYRTATMHMLDMVQSSCLLVQCRYEVKL